MKSVLAVLLSVLCGANGQISTPQQPESDVASTSSISCYNGIDRALFKYIQNGSLGYMDCDGNIIIDAKFTKASDFSEGIAAVEDGYIDSSGSYIIQAVTLPLNKPYRHQTSNQLIQNGTIHNRGDFNNGFACITTIRSGIGDYEYVYIDKNGKNRFSENYQYIYSFSEGYAVVLKEGNFPDFGYQKWSYINQSGKYTTSETFDNARSFKNGIAIVSQNGKYGAVDKNFDLIIPYQYDYISDYSDGIFVVFKNGKYQFIDINNQVKVGLGTKYDEVSGCSNGRVKVRESGKYGYVDKDGAPVIACVFDGANDFSENVAAVQKDGKWHIISTAGEYITTSGYNYIGDAKNGLIPVLDENANPLYYIDMTGKEIRPKS